MSFRARISPLCLGVATGVVAAFELRPLVLESPRSLALSGRIADDAFFYTVLASRFWTDGIFSFDGEMPTNGVQPAWMALSSAAQALNPGGDSLAPMLALSWLLFAIFAGCTTGYWCRHASWPSAVAAALAYSALIAANPAFQTLSVKGLETPLLLALVPLLLVLIDRIADAPRRPPPLSLQVGLALTAAALFLTRTDMLWASVVLFGWRLWRGGVREGVLFACVTAVCVGPYLAANLVVGGSLIPISGRVKLFYLANVTPELGGYLASDEWLGFIAAFGSVFPFGHVGEWLAFPALVATAVWTHVRHQHLGTGIRMLGIIALVHAVFMHLVYREIRPYTGYYFAVELVWIGAVAAAALAELAARRPRLALALSACVALAVSISAIRNDDEIHLRREWEARLALADDIRAIAPPAERVAAFWPGAFSYFSGRDVIPLDGVIGSQAYFESHLKAGREFGYLEERRAAYLALFLPIPPEQLRSLERSPVIRSWADLGARRLWEQRGVSWKSASERPFTRRGGGWFLIELPWRCCR